jgi:hypothetical protein
MLSDEEIIRQLKAVRHSDVTERNARRAPSMNAISERVGVSLNYLYRLCKGEPLGRYTRQKLSDFFTTEQNDGERSAVCQASTAAFSTGSGSVFTVKWPDFGPERPRKRGLSDRRS